MPITLHTYERELSLGPLNTSAIVSAVLEPSLLVEVPIIGRTNGTLSVSLTNQAGDVINEASMVVEGGTNAKMQWDLRDKVSLWWPAGEGPQTLYTVTVRLLSVSI